MTGIAETSVSRFARAIGYPQEVPAAATSFVFLVDGREIVVEERGGALVARRRLAASRDDLVMLASLATGRLLREEATLAWDAAAQAPVLWQQLAGDAAAQARQFTDYLNALDWWEARLGEGRRAPVQLPELVIRP